jgi:hypothetical protein
MKQYTNQEMVEKYGKPNQAGTYLAYAKMPFPLIIAWDTSVTVSRIRCHKLEVANVEAIFNEILNAYGLDKIHALNIHLFGGCFNYRPIRGGSTWSRHSWGAAIDLDPARNQLHQQGDTAEFSKKEYRKMIDIFEAHGWLSLGRLKNYDWMHFEAASTKTF